ncbi:hypothetical protein K439DRAFT_447236 [Ramaria rubella]|nr:hypothetical protein K439DRAFT_447236 [Ramaria rubella]
MPLKLAIFAGMACFSPRVSSDVQTLWSRNGGTIALSVQERRNSSFYFCNGPDDPWLSKLATSPHRVVKVLYFGSHSFNPIQVFHANWICASINHGYAIAMASYVLDRDN